MNAKEKAIELVNKYLQIYDGRVPQAKQCSLIAIDLRLEMEYGKDRKEYWNEVKQEIEKL